MSRPTWRLIPGDCIEVMATLPETSVDAIVCDPPYGLGFMGKQWDDLPPGLPWARECLRVLKPGGHLLAFGGTRTYHRLTCAVEDAGFEIRDCLAWLYGSGFPKSHNVSASIDKAQGHRPRGRAIPTASTYQASDTEQRHKLTSNPVEPYGARTPDAEPWQGWGTALKPAHEPVVMARKPLVGTVAGNVLAHGTGALNVDGCRIEGVPEARRFDPAKHSHDGWRFNATGEETAAAASPAGRWPANVLLDPEAAAMLDEQTGDVWSGGNTGNARAAGAGSLFGSGAGLSPDGVKVAHGWGGPSRFFYVAKASSAERNTGLKGARNSHPTVKPVNLMRWLVRLVTPPGGTVLDPFTGSGTTGIAALREGFSFIGIEREPEYVDIARARIIGDAPLMNGHAELPEAA